MRETGFALAESDVDPAWPDAEAAFALAEELAGSASCRSISLMVIHLRGSRPLPAAERCPLAPTASRALPAVASHAIGYADPRSGVHSRGFGAYEEMAQSRLNLSRVEVTDRDDMPPGLHDPRAEGLRA